MMVMSFIKGKCMSLVSGSKSPFLETSPVEVNKKNHIFCHKKWFLNVSIFYATNVMILVTNVAKNLS